MMIQDEELRSLYHTVGLERMQKLQAGLLDLEQQPTDVTVLETLRREIHSLKGDSNLVGLDQLTALSQQIENILKALQHRAIDFTLAVSDRLYAGIQTAEHLLHEAATGESSGVDFDTVHRDLSQLLIPQPEGVSTKDAKPGEHLEAALYIADDELRTIYSTTTEGRLYALESSLHSLSTGPEDGVAIELLRREIHSLKGDSRAVGLEPLAELIQPLEDIIQALQQQSSPLTPKLGETLADGFAVVRQLVHEAVTGEASGVELAPMGRYFQAIAATALVPPGAKQIARSQPSEPAMASKPRSAAATSAPIRIDLIADLDLREIYRITSDERLQAIETHLLYLEQHPQDEATLQALLREAHSLKGDARSAGVEAVEAIAHAMEAVLVAVQQRAIRLDPETSDRLYQGVDILGQIVQAAAMDGGTVTNPTSLVQALQAIAPEPLSGTLPDSAIAVSPDASGPHPAEPVIEPAAPLSPALARDTLRVQTRDLDTLLAQAEELAVTRIQVAQTAAQTQQLVALWEEWQANQPTAYPEQMEALMMALRTTAQDNSRKLDAVAEDIRHRVRKLQLLPLSSLFQPLPRLVRDLARQQDKRVDLLLEGEALTADKRLLEGIKDALTHLVRNAVDHGIETPGERIAAQKPATATLRVTARQTAISLTLEISDDGRGLDIDQIKRTALKRGLHSQAELDAMPLSQVQRLILAPGFSTRRFITEISGRGVGLDVLRAQVERLKGAIQIDSIPGQGCTFRIQLSTTLSTANVVLVAVQGHTFALPIEFLQMSLLVSPSQVAMTEQQRTISVAGEAVPVVDLAAALELRNSPLHSRMDPPTAPDGPRPCVLLKVGEAQAGFFVDRLIAQQEVASKPAGALLQRVRNVSGATVLSTGEVCPILSPPDLLKSVQQQPADNPAPQTPPRKLKILLVEDSPLVRIQEQRLFEGVGYEVTTANHGLEGYNTLRTHRFDAVVSDVEMPHLDGFALVAKIRQHSEYDDLPIILVTTLDSEADRQQGADAGANGYIVKGRFNQEVLLETLERLI